MKALSMPACPFEYFTHIHTFGLSSRFVDDLGDRWLEERVHCRAGLHYCQETYTFDRSL